jgi:hypothetical protein
MSASFFRTARLRPCQPCESLTGDHSRLASPFPPRLTRSQTSLAPETAFAACRVRNLPSRAADIMAAINRVHPFREGNGRAQRVFLEQLAHAAGHDLDFTVISRERMIQASIAAHEQDDTSMMRRMFNEISDPGRVALLRASLAALDKLDIEWNDRYVATIAQGIPSNWFLQEFPATSSWLAPHRKSCSAGFPICPSSVPSKVKVSPSRRGRNVCRV